MMETKREGYIIGIDSGYGESTAVLSVMRDGHLYVLGEGKGLNINDAIRSVQGMYLRSFPWWKRWIPMARIGWAYLTNKISFVVGKDSRAR